MHELSIAVSMIELAEEEAARLGGVRVSAIHLKMGPLSGVAKEALISCYELACEGTSLEGSRLVIEQLPEGRDLLVSALEVCDPDTAEAVAST